MAPRKAELLELLRKQNAAQPHAGGRVSGDSSTVTRDDPSPASVSEPKHRERDSLASSLIGRPKRSGPSSSFPWPVALLGLALAVPLIWWFAGVFHGPKDPLSAAGMPPPGAAASSPLAESPGATRPDGGALPSAAVPGPAFAVVVVQYDYNTRNKGYARDLLVALKAHGFPEANAWAGPDSERPEKLYVTLGRADDAASLAALRDQVRVLEYPAGSGEKPFADAYVSRLPGSP